MSPNADRPCPPRRRGALASLLAACALLFALAPLRAQDVVADFSAGPPSGRYAFASSTPKTFGDLFKDRSQQGDPVNVVGHLFLPPADAAASRKLPAVVFMHGSGGVYSAMLDYWPKRLNAAGIAMLAVDSFGPRGVQSTADDQSQVPFAADVADAFAALRLLASHPRIDASRIAIVGTSRGGITAWRTAVERVIAAQGGGLRFAAHVPMYSGGCAGAFPLVVRPGVFSKAPMLWLHGDADDYTPMVSCRDYAERIRQAGTPVEFVVVEGARHKFDDDGTRRIYLRAAQRSLPDCPIEMDIDTLYAYDRASGQRLAGDAYREALKKCSALGASVEGDRGAREKAAQAVTGFLGRVLAER